MNEETEKNIPQGEEIAARTAKGVATMRQVAVQEPVAELVLNIIDGFNRDNPADSGSGEPARTLRRLHRVVVDLDTLRIEACRGASNLDQLASGDDHGRDDIAGAVRDFENRFSVDVSSEPLSGQQWFLGGSKIGDALRTMAGQAERYHRLLKDIHEAGEESLYQWHAFGELVEEAGAKDGSVRPIMARILKGELGLHQALVTLGVPVDHREHILLFPVTEDSHTVLVQYPEHERVAKHFRYPEGQAPVAGVDFGYEVAWAWDQDVAAAEAGELDPDDSAIEVDADQTEEPTEDCPHIDLHEAARRQREGGEA